MLIPPKGVRPTGVVGPAPVFAKGADGKSRPTGEQLKDASGVPVWDIEVLMTTEEFGRDKNVTATVQVPARTQPQLAPFEAIEFVNLTATIYGEPKTYWNAATLARAKAE